MKNKRRHYVLIGGSDHQHSEQISNFYVSEKVIKIEAELWLQKFPWVAYYEVNWKHSNILQKPREKAL